MSPCTTAISVSSDAFLPFASRDVWPRLAETVDAPAEALARVEGRLLRWKHTGSKGWLPVDDPTAELRLTSEPGGTRLSFRVEAMSAPEVSALVRRRLESYVAGVLAACAGGVRRAVGSRSQSRA